MKPSIHVLFNSWEKRRGAYIVSVGWPNPDDRWGLNARTDRTHYRTERQAMKAARDLALEYGVTALDRNGDPIR